MDTNTDREHRPTLRPFHDQFGRIGAPRAARSNSTRTAIREQLELLDK